jgi:hypothetical protein
MEIVTGAINSIRIDLGDLPNKKPALPSPASQSKVVAAPKDSVDVATPPVPSVSQVEPLLTTNPIKFEAVLSDAVRQLRAASRETTDPVKAAYYSTLADRFQRLQDGVPDSRA